MRRQYSQLTRDKTQWQIMWESASPSQRSQMENFLKELILAGMLYFPASNGKIYNYRQYIVTELFGVDRKTYLAAKQDLLESRMITASNRLTKKGQMTKIRDIQSLLFDLNDGVLDYTAQGLYQIGDSFMERMNYPELVKNVLARHTENHISKETEKELIFDCERNRYLVVHVGWENNERAYGTTIHVDIINEKIWIQKDLTEEGVASKLVELGVLKSDIVLGFKSPYVRQFTDFAVE